MRILVRPIRRSFGAKWLTWSALDAIRRTSPVSSNRPRRRSATGSRNLIGERAAGRRGPTSYRSPTAQLIRLRRENKQLRLERDILSRAAAWFARETGAVPSGSSNS